MEEGMESVAEKWGEEMVGFILATGMAQEAAERLTGRRNTSQERYALVALVTSFNALGTLVIDARGWTGETLAACEQDIKLAAAGRLVESKPKIILAS
jgi:hypothetical protein